MTDSQRIGTPAGGPAATWQWQDGAQTGAAASVPVQDAQAAAPAAPVDAAPAHAAEPAALPPAHDYEADLAAKDTELKALQQKMEGIEGASRDAQGERQKMVVEMARLVNERESIEKAKNEELTKRQEQLDEVSQATQTLAQKTMTLEQQLAEATAKATKLEVLTNEFPNLLKYAQFIPPSGNSEEVRGYCQAFQQTREADLGEYRQMIATGYAARTVPTGAPATRAPEPIGDVTQLESRLTQAMTDPRMFEEELSAAIRNYEARRP